MYRQNNVPRVQKLFLVASTTLMAAGSIFAQAQPRQAPVLEEIIVTAQKRAENMQDAPITIQALTSEQLAAAGTNGTIDLGMMVPGLIFNKGLTAGVPYIRGVGQNVGSLGVESPVATYLDGIYLVGPASTLLSFNNIERVEVAKGPQGTLFGRNATGGVINVITREPESDFSANGSLGYGNYSTYKADVYVTGGVTDTVATSFAAFIADQRDGYINNISLNREVGQTQNYGFQNKWRWTPSDGTDVGLNLLYYWRDGWQGTTLGVYPGSVADDRITTHVDERTVTAGIDTENRTWQGLAALTVHQDVGFARLTNILGYRRLDDEFGLVQNAEPLHRPLLAFTAAVTSLVYGEQETITEELQLQSQSDADLRWIVGLYYLHDKTRLNGKNLRDGLTQFVPPVGPSVQDTRQKTESYAMYVDATKTVLPETRLTLGVRYTEDEKTLEGLTQQLLASGSTALITPDSTGLDTPKKWDEWTYRAVIDHDFTPESMGYLSYNHGFKSGVYNLANYANPPADPETVDAYEVGLKNELFNRRLRLNVAAFYYDYQDIQLRQVVVAPNFVLLNAASAEVKGVDIDFTGLVTSNLTVSGGFGVLNAKYKDFPGAPVAVPNPVSAVPTGCTGVLTPAAAFLGGNSTFACDLSGTRMMRSPKYTGNLGVQYDLPLSGGAGLKFNVADAYNSGFFWEPDHLVRQKSYHNVRGSVTWTAPSRSWDISLWGENLTNEDIFSYAAAGPTSTFSPGTPRMYGISFKART
jgi:iron complex outermembrane receptor protein